MTKDQPHGRTLGGAGLQAYDDTSDLGDLRKSRFLLGRWEHEFAFTNDITHR